ncbi:MAG: YbaB/EbfC family nucleoid-associated protein [Gammaproteobacteria bacterium]
MFNKGNIGNMMRQAQQMQEAMQKAQAELGNIEVTGEAGSGLVKVTMTGKHQVKRVQVAPGAVGDDLEMLEDLLTVAMNDAVAKVEAAVQAKYAAVTAGMRLPPGMKLPF